MFLNGCRCGFCTISFVVYPMTAHPKLFSVIDGLGSTLGADGLLLHGDGLKSLR